MILVYDALFNDTYQLTDGGAPQSSLMKCLFVLLLRSGFILIQASCVPVQNIYIILMKNFIDMAAALLSYTFIGFTLSNGYKAFQGFLGFGKWIESDILFLPDAIQGYLSVLMGTGIISASLSGRMHVATLIINCIIYSSILQPILMYWTWSGDGLFYAVQVQGVTYGNRDYGGLVAVHLSAAIVSLMGIFFLGRRVMILRSMDPLSIGLESTGRAIIGYTFIILGTIAFELPSFKMINPLFESELTSLIVVNNLIAIGTSIFVVTICHVMVYHRQIFSYWVFVRTLQSAYAGVVTISGGVDVFSPLSSLLITVLSSLLFFAVAFGLHMTAFEDNCNVAAIHFNCAFFGNLCTGIFKTTRYGWNLGVHTGTWYQLMVWLSAFIFITISMTIVYVIISCTRILSGDVESRNHLMAENIKKSQKKKFYRRLFSIKQRRRYFEPATILRLMQYNSPFKPMSNQEEERFM
ncbi:ammonium transporter 2-like isoform X1 [Aethina tumida]|uniref:ammonium transporter 2-like isoform X1 n=1 Tax=Aethina tumida TaxID=116153 RepID=UPI0021492B93|nr:ammonium transporter 2-like isoform X1 [Aethina tumida]